MAKGKPEWFKMFLNFEPLIKAVPSQNVGDGVKAAMAYFKAGVEPDDLDGMSMAIYTMLRDSIDQAFLDIKEKSDKARTSAKARWNEKGDATACDRMQPHATAYDTMQTEKENRSIRQTRLKHIPTLDEVESYIRERGLSVHAERFVNYYNESGWQSNGEPVKDWRKLLDSWDEHERPTKSSTNRIDDSNPLLHAKFY